MCVTGCVRSRSSPTHPSPHPNRRRHQPLLHVPLKPHPRRVLRLRHTEERILTIPRHITLCLGDQFGEVTETDFQRVSFLLEEAVAGLGSLLLAFEDLLVLAGGGDAGHGAGGGGLDGGGREVGRRKEEVSGGRRVCMACMRGVACPSVCQQCHKVSLSV